MKLISGLTVIAIFASQNVIAAIKWTNPVDIAYVRALENGGFMIQTANVVDSNCPGGGRQFYAMAGQNWVTADGLKPLFSISLTSVTAAKKLNILYDDADPNCYIRNLEMGSSGS